MCGAERLACRRVSRAAACGTPSWRRALRRRPSRARLLRPARHRLPESTKTARGSVSPVAPRRSVVAATWRRRIRASRTTNYLLGVSYVHRCTLGGPSLQALVWRFGGIRKRGLLQRAPVPRSAVASHPVPPSANPFVCRMFAERPFGALARALRNHKLPAKKRKRLVDRSGFEPLTSAVQRRRSPN